LLGYDKEAERLQHILNQEGEADKKLTQLAEGDLFEDGINEAAIKAN
ncbi:MAG: ferritin-like domain-containing protein, partial [Phycisphaerae bacterium]|nr:ferritin-like domain-containing protein [Phycisphaerae bacterium]NIP52992.1 ferritin-like domain-containing protein [Phycisphaerae bacterium]NIX29079.1 ferritin-like domain-containing protein [Phycisphaerae bacterium]